MWTMPIPVCPIPAPVQNPYQWIPLTPIEQMEKTEYDVVIVGTGAGGGAVLWRLAQQWAKSGKRICVVEAGYPVAPTHLMNMPTYTNERLAELWNSTTVGLYWPDRPAVQDLAAASLPWALKRFHALGGRTLLWAVTAPRLDPMDFAGWPIIVFFRQGRRESNTNYRGSGHTHSRLYGESIERLRKASA